MSSERSRRRIFFVHIQKTAGGTLRHFLVDRLPAGAVYPHSPYEENTLDAYFSVPRLKEISDERMRQIQIFVGHFPYIASQLVDTDVTTLALLRDPVERTVSYLRMRAQDPERKGMTAEEIYNHKFDFPIFIHNHQAKVFSFIKDDNPQSFMDKMEVTPERLAIAKRHLEKIDVLGLQERAQETYDEIVGRFGLVWEEAPKFHVTDKGLDIPSSLLDQIVEDNAVDIEFYNYAVKLYDHRRQECQ